MQNDLNLDNSLPFSGMGVPGLGLSLPKAAAPLCSELSEEAGPSPSATINYFIFLFQVEIVSKGMDIKE